MPVPSALPETRNGAAVVIQAHARGYIVRKSMLSRGSTMFKTHFAYMDLRRMTPMERLAMVAIGLAHQVVYVLLFTEPGWGDELYRALAMRGAIATALGISAVGVAVVLFLADAMSWPARWAPLRAAGLVLVVALLAAAVMALGGTYPQAPIALYILAVPLGWYLLRTTAYPHVSLGQFLGTIALSSGSGGGAMLLGWVCWLAIIGGAWSGDLRARYYGLVLCDPDASSCLAGAILFFSPLACAMANIGLALAMTVLAAYTLPTTHKTLHVMVRVFGGLLVAVIGAMYVQAALSGATSALANAILLFSLTGLVGGAVVVAGTLGWAATKKRLLSVPLVRKAATALSSDWAKAVLVLGGWPPFAIYVVLSVAKQRIRVCRRTDPQTCAVLTTEGRVAVQAVRAWRLTSVLSKANVVAILFLLFNVGAGRLTNVFVSWLIDVLVSADVHIAVVIAVFLGAGLSLFMIPPVPGFAVYLFGAFLFPQLLPFWLGVATAVALSFFLKLAALVIQQKGIGERMSGSVRVRALVGVNSLTMRAIRLILEEKGLTTAKVAILVAGPDWPTSVTCGLLRLPLLPMVVGTAPVIVVVAAVTIAASFQLRRSEGPLWAAISDLALAMASAVMFGTLVFAAHLVEVTAERHRALLLAIPRDAAVDAEDARASRYQEVFLRRTDWHTRLPVGWKLVLVLGAGLQMAACWVAQLFSHDAFESFQMTDSIDEDLDGDWTNLFRPLGRAVLIASAAGFSSLVAFQVWASRRVAVDVTAVRETAQVT